MTITNHPLKGSTIRIDPITDLDAIKRIKKNLSGNQRDYALFVFGINSSLKATDLLRLRTGDIRRLRAGEFFVIRENATGQLRNVVINKAVFEAVRDLLATMPDAQDGDFLFSSRKYRCSGQGVMTISYLNSLIKKWCRDAGLQGNYGAHTLRKTFGYVHLTYLGTDVQTLLEMFRYQKKRQLFSYLGIPLEEPGGAYLKEI